MSSKNKGALSVKWLAVLFFAAALAGCQTKKTGGTLTVNLQNAHGATNSTTVTVDGSNVASLSTTSSASCGDSNSNSVYTTTYSSNGSHTVSASNNAATWSQQSYDVKDGGCVIVKLQ